MELNKSEVKILIDIIDQINVKVLDAVILIPLRNKLLEILNSFPIEGEEIK